jgi:rhodanese-related sulfurtransferase
MNLPSIAPSQVRSQLLLREEIALLDVRHEAAFATGHPLFAANMAAERIGGLEAAARLPARTCLWLFTTPAMALCPRRRSA